MLSCSRHRKVPPKYRNKPPYPSKISRNGSQWRGTYCNFFYCEVAITVKYSIYSKNVFSRKVTKVSSQNGHQKNIKAKAHGSLKFCNRQSIVRNTKFELKRLNRSQENNHTEIT